VDIEQRTRVHLGMKKTGLAQYRVNRSIRLELGKDPGGVFESSYLRKAFRWQETFL
jgi:hypothetical protein